MCPPLVSLRAMAPAARLTLGCPVLDGLMQGGVLTGGITEIVGKGEANLCGEEADPTPHDAPAP